MGCIPIDARYFKIRLIGGESSVDVAGTTYFDWVHFFDSQLPCFFGDESFCLNASEKSTNSTTYVRLKQTRLQGGGDIRVKFDLRTDTAGSDSLGQIYKNGTAIGTERSTEITTYTTFSEDIANWLIGDYVELYVRGNTGYNSCCRNLDLCRRFPPWKGEILE